MIELVTVSEETLSRIWIWTVVIRIKQQSLWELLYFKCQLISYSYVIHKLLDLTTMYPAQTSGWGPSFSASTHLARSTCFLGPDTPCFGWWGTSMVPCPECICKCVTEQSHCLSWTVAGWAHLFYFDFLMFPDKSMKEVIFTNNITNIDVLYNTRHLE